jgi:hypothetical protein
MSFFTKTTKKENRGLFGSKSSNQDAYGSEYDTEPEDFEKARKTPPAGNNNSNNAEQTSIFADAARKRRRRPSHDAEDESQAVFEDRRSPLGVKSRRTIPESEGSDDGAEMIRATGENRKAGASSRNLMGEFKRPKFSSAFSATPQESVHASIDEKSLAGIITTSQLKTMEREVRKALSEREAVLAVQETDLDNKQVELDMARGKRDRAIRHVHESKGRLSAIRSLLDKA